MPTVTSSVPSPPPSPPPPARDTRRADLPPPGSSTRIVARPVARPAASSASGRSRNWRARLPELVAGTGLAFVAAAVMGFLSSTWTDLGDGGKALLLLAAAAGLTSAANMADGRGEGLARLGNVVWAAGSVTLAGAVVLAGQANAPDLGRIGLAVAGVAGVAHVGWRFTRRPDAWVLVVTGFGLAVMAAGPPGSRLDQNFSAIDASDLFLPIAGLLDVTLTSPEYAVTGALHAALGLAALALARQLPTVTATAAKVGGTALLWYAAAELNVLDAEVGAVAALVIVLGHLAHGLVSDDTLLVVLGTLGSLLAGIRVVTALFSGEVAVTISVFSCGIAMLVWAWRAAQRRADGSEDQRNRGPEDPTGAAPSSAAPQGESDLTASGATVRDTAV